MVADVFGLHVKTPRPEQIEAAAKQAYLNNRAGQTPWEQLDETRKTAWRGKVKKVVEAALNA